MEATDLVASNLFWVFGVKFKMIVYPLQVIRGSTFSTLLSEDSLLSSAVNKMLLELFVNY